MNINIYQDYKIKYKAHYGWIDEENSLPDDISFTDDDFDNEYVLNGGVLLEKIEKHFLEDWLQEFIINNNKIRFEYFNPSNGEGWNYEYKVEVVNNQEND